MIKNGQVNNRGRKCRGCPLFIGSLVIFLLAGCYPGELTSPTPESTANPTAEPEPTVKPIVSSPLTDAFPGADAVAGWTPEGELTLYDSETIFRLVNGQADFFFVYGFEQVAAQRYENTDGIVLDVQIWQLAQPA